MTSLRVSTKLLVNVGQLFEIYRGCASAESAKIRKI
jgi:hypothetical protein